MSTPEQTRLAAQNPDRPSSSALAYADQQARIAADEAQLRAGGPHSDEVLSHHQGLPTVETQMKTHGAAPPKVPDTGGHDSPSAHMG